MLSYCNNDFLSRETTINTECQMLFYQKMRELLYMHSGISYSFKIHNSYSILQELLDTIEDYEKSKIIGMIVEEIRREAESLLSEDIVIKSKHRELFEIIKEEISSGLKIDKNNQSIEQGSIAKMNIMKEAIKQLFVIFKPIDYFKTSIVLTKEAIDSNEGDRVIKLCVAIVSSSMMVGRTIAGMYKAIEVIFQNKDKAFDDNWRRWSAIMLNIVSAYKCFIPIDKKYREEVSLCQQGSDIKQQNEIVKGVEYLEDEGCYLVKEIEAPASDLSAIYNKVFAAYRDELAIVEFTTAKIDELPYRIFVYDTYNKNVIEIEQKETQREYTYKPFNQYHVNIDTALKGFVSELNQEDYGKVIGAIVNVCNFENESNEYRFLALWSSLEALFRSTQYEKVIGAIKNIIPDIITRRYIYYRLLDFIRDAYKAGVSYNYRGRDFVKKMPGDADVEALFMLLREDEKFYQLADICKRKYVLLYHKCKDIKNMTINSGAIKNTIAHHKEILEFHLQRMYRVRNKFVHHAEIDKNIDALYKHLLVYSWECIREMAYVSKTRGIKSLEELYSYFRMNYKVAMKYLRDTENEISFINIKEGYII